MNEMIPASIAAAASLLAGLLGVGVFTREGRLINRVRRLGEVYALMPDSPERVLLKGHLLRASAEMNEWIDPARNAQRWIVRSFTFILFFLAMWALSALRSALGLGVVPTTFVALPLGLLIGAASVGVGALLQRFVAIRADRRTTAARLDRLSRGEDPMFIDH